MEIITIRLQKYLAHCEKHKRLSENTMRAYRIDIGQFVAYLKRHHIDDLTARDINKEVIQNYVNEMISTYAPRSCKRKIACLKSFFSHLEFEDEILVNPFRKIRIKLNEPKTLPRVIKRRDVREQMQFVNSSVHQAKTVFKKFLAIRTMACYELLIGTGLRVGELCHLKVDAIDLDNLTIRILGKGRKERIVYLASQQVIDAIRSYSQIKQTCRITSEYFFTNWNGSRMKEGTVRRLIREIGKAVTHRRITPHMFRHTFATALLEKNIDISFIQVLLGHSSIKTTQIYLHLSNTAIRSALMSAKLREQYI